MRLLPPARPPRLMDSLDQFCSTALLRQNPFFKGFFAVRGVVVTGGEVAAEGRAAR